MNLTSRWLVAILDAAVPKAVADDLVGDLVESGRASALEVVRALWHCAPIVALHLAGPEPARPIAGALGGALVAVAGFGAWWRYVLALVPWRAGHSPSPVLLLIGVIAVLFCAAAGFLLLRRTPPSDSTWSISPSRNHP